MYSQLLVRFMRGLLFHRHMFIAKKVQSSPVNLKNLASAQSCFPSAGNILIGKIKLINTTHVTDRMRITTRIYLDLFARVDNSEYILNVIRNNIVSAGRGNYRLHYMSSYNPLM